MSIDQGSSGLGVLNEIHRKLTANPAMAEVDAHVGSLARQVRRLEEALGKAMDTAQEKILETETHLRSIAQADAVIAGLRHEIESLRMELHLSGNEPQTPPALTPEPSDPQA